MKKSFALHRNQAVIYTNGNVCRTTEELLNTSIFTKIVELFVEELIKSDSEYLKILPEKGKNHDELVELLKELSKNKIEEVKKEKKWRQYTEDTYTLHQLVEKLYNFWRTYERYLVCYTEPEKNKELHLTPYRTFRESIETINHLVRKAYRDICENITGKHPRVYRQVPAGCQIGIIGAHNHNSIPEKYKHLKEIPIIRQVLIEPPLIIDPPVNTRKGQFKETKENPFLTTKINKEEWHCYPAKVGSLVIYVYFHDAFMSLGASLANLFDIAEDEDLKQKPDAIYLYGAETDLEEPFFYEDKQEKMFTAICPQQEKYGYFGYLKKMILTLHNIIMIKKGRMPVHGAMTKITMRNGKEANIIIMGDTGTGKSETLEAFRTLGKEMIKEMVVIFDDMGSLEEQNGKIKAYGTETGAFVRLDDLSPGYALGNIDRSIIMSPHKINARALIPITTIEEVLKGYEIDYFLYANNYEQVDEEHPFYEEFKSSEEAIDVFREGARMAKGTTNEVGLVKAYYANVFGPFQRQEEHEPIAEKFIKLMFKNGIKVGQLRTRLGIPGFENSGPIHAAEALLRSINK